MQNFEYCVPTKVVFGRDTESRCGELVRECGGTHALVVYGGGSAVRSGLLDCCTDSLKAANIPYELLGGVQPNPRLSRVRDGIALAKETGADFLLAIGGGSVIDTAKAIGYALANPEFDIWDLFMGKATAKACAPVGAVLTIAAAGSETSNSCVITNEDGWKKRGLNTDLCRPRFAVMDPELTFTLPAYQTASGCVDIIYHTMERYFSGAETVEPTDSMAEGLMRSMLELSRRVVRDPRDYDARAGIMWAGSLSHNSLTGCGRGGRGRIGDWASHQLEHELSGMFDVTHGAGLAAVWGAWSRYVMDAAPERFARFARAVMGVDTPGSDEETALAGIRAFEHFLRSIGMPTTVGQLGITLDEQAIEKLAWMCTFEGRRTIGSFKVLGLEEIKDIYRAAR